MANRAFINGDVLTWARERADMPLEELAAKVGQKPDKIVAWEAGEEQPTFKQAMKLANFTHIPLGYLFLSKRPIEELPLPDLRTIGSTAARPLNSNTKDLLQDVLFKHGWFIDHLIEHGHEPLAFVGKYKITDDATVVAQDIRTTLNLAGAAQQASNWENYIRLLIDYAERAGVWVMRSGVVGNNTHRPLDTRQFRGFAISDAIAPLIFINGKDALAAQIFTFAHELAHIWVGTSGISNLEIGKRDFGNNQDTEIFCNRVAAELLVPREEFATAWNANLTDRANFDSLSQAFKVSQIVVARRAFDLGNIAEDTYARFYSAEQKRWDDERERDKPEGGNFFNTFPIRNGTRFTRAVVSRAGAGETLLRDAGSLLNVQPSFVVKYFRKALAQ